jgi:hypothetical protein
MNVLATARVHVQRDQRPFLLQRAQPTMTGLIDGPPSTLALLRHRLAGSVISVTLVGAITAAVSAALGAVS